MEELTKALQKAWFESLIKDVFGEDETKEVSAAEIRKYTKIFIKEMKKLAK